MLAQNPLLFDWRQLQRWWISKDKLPPNSLICYREQTLWEFYRGLIIGFLEEASPGIQQVAFPPSGK